MTSPFELKAKMTKRFGAIATLEELAEVMIYFLGEYGKPTQENLSADLVALFRTVNIQGLYPVDIASERASPQSFYKHYEDETVRQYLICQQLQLKNHEQQYAHLNAVGYRSTTLLAAFDDEVQRDISKVSLVAVTPQFSALTYEELEVARRLGSKLGCSEYEMSPDRRLAIGSPMRFRKAIYLTPKVIAAEKEKIARDFLSVSSCYESYLGFQRAQNAAIDTIVERLLPLHLRQE